MLVYYDPIGGNMRDRAILAPSLDCLNPNEMVWIRSDSLWITAGVVVRPNGVKYLETRYSYYHIDEEDDRPAVFVTLSMSKDVMFRPKPPDKAWAKEGF